MLTLKPELHDPWVNTDLTNKAPRKTQENSAMATVK